MERWITGSGRGQSLTSSACSIVDGTNAGRSWKKTKRVEDRERSRGRTGGRGKEGNKRIEF